MNGRSVGHLRQHRMWWIVTAVVAVALVAGGVGWRMHPGRGIRVGDRFDQVTVFSGQTKDRQFTVPMAFGSLSVTVGAGDQVGEHDHLVQAPDGATLVEVSWAPVTTFGSPPVYRAVYVAGLGAAPAGKEWLVVDGASATRKQRSITVYGEGRDYAKYVPSGPPKVSVTVDGVRAKPRIAGKDTVIGASVRVAARAWLVDADRSSVVRLRYRLPTTIDRARSQWPGAPAAHQVDVSTRTTYPAA